MGAQEKSKKNYVNYLCVIAAGLLWSTMSLFTSRFKANGLTEFEMMAIRAYFSMLLLLIYNLITNRHGMKLKKITDAKYFIGSGLIGILLSSWAYMKSINLSSAGVAATLLYTAPAIVMVLSLFLFGEKLTVRKVIILLMTLLGCLCVTGFLEDRDNISTAGILFGLCSGFSYAMYTICTTFALRKYSTISISFFTFVMAALFMLPFAGSVLSKVFELNLFGFCIFFALITTVLPFTLYTNGLSKIETSKASLMASVEPMAAAVIGIVVFNESASVIKIAGIALVAVSVIMAGRQ
ncbi:MAG: DMT family transporter [Clostridiales bacterium]|nr:DMT family transporter [Clostridiales bacterium]